MTEQELNEKIYENSPPWFDCRYCDVDTIRDIQQGGCESGAYMPAVTYYEARKVMSEHGDDVLEYIEQAYGEIPQPNTSESWSGIAVFYLSYAVDLWANGFDLDEIEEEE
tara:strand:+ start:5809 stop:6138 length:330 start_codon:yes stop_codon:yes gene_type:complete